MSAQHTAARRTMQTAFGHTVFVRPPARMPHPAWSNRLESRALADGYIAVIDGRVIEPGSPEARAAIAKAAGSAA